MSRLDPRRPESSASLGEEDYLGSLQFSTCACQNVAFLDQKTEDDWSLHTNRANQL